ncbi:AzlD domain-containing protein [Aliagarivorans taiwanensis]|uniref:AzlD domain-containing protein n=1 Tax=Aliagarivorans taiwanensis TaxID=561966 RepID=UPI00041C1600|nr:AzlD domain-containing protein [Aliagarivorans taiwanensis]
MIWLAIILMTLVVFTSRYLFLEPKLPLKLNRHARGILAYSSAAVLTALWVPLVFIPEGELNLKLSNPYLVAALVAIVLAKATKNVLLTTVLSMLLFFGLKQWLG